MQETRPGQRWSRLEVWTSPRPAPGKPGAGFDGAPVDGQPRSAHVAAHPIGWIRGLHPASRAKTPHTSSGPRAEGPERRRSPAVTPELHHPNAHHLPGKPGTRVARSGHERLLTVLFGVAKSADHHRPPSSYQSRSALGPKPSGMTTNPSPQRAGRLPVQPKLNRPSFVNAPSGYPSDTFVDTHHRCRVSRTTRNRGRGPSSSAEAAPKTPPAPPKRRRRLNAPLGVAPLEPVAPALDTTVSSFSCTLPRDVHPRVAPEAWPRDPTRETSSTEMRPKWRSRRGCPL